MRMVDDWRTIVLKAWSVRLIILAGVLQGAEIALPLINKALPIPPMTFAVASLVVTAAAFVARLTAQRNMKAPD